LLPIALACVACRGDITMHGEWHKESIPVALRSRASEGYSEAVIEGGPVTGAYTTYPNGPPTDDVGRVDIPLDSRLTDRHLHIRTVYLDANGLALYEGEGDQTIADGATLSVTLSPTGPQ
jgi:hypothetical protein